MRMRFTTGLRWAAICVVGMALFGLVGCGGGSSGGGGGGGAFAGNYAGTFTGTDRGTLAFAVDGDGVAAGTAYSTMEGIGYIISGDVNESGELSAGLYSSGLYEGSYQGTIDAGGAVRGTWSNEAGTDSGTFNAQRQ